MKIKVSSNLKNENIFILIWFVIFEIIIFGLYFDFKEKDLTITFFNFSFSFFRIFKYRIFYVNEWYDYIERFVWGYITILRITILNIEFSIKLDDNNLIIIFSNKSIIIKF
jgi:hypothetical protein